MVLPLFFFFQSFMGPGAFFPNIAQLYHHVHLLILKRVNYTVLYVTSVACDISDETSSSPVLFQISVPHMMKGRESFKKRVEDEKIERKGKSVEYRNPAHLSNTQVFCPSLLHT